MDKQYKSDMIIYNDGELELSVSVDEETLWLTQKQIAQLFEVTVPNINMHIKSIYKEEELFENRTIQKYLIVQKEGNREAGELMKLSDIFIWIKFNTTREQNTILML